MPSERYGVSEETAAAIERVRARGNRVVAIGTTSVRALESAARRSTPAARQSRLVEPSSAATDLYLLPEADGSADPRAFGVVDALMTNFHLPKSTLLMMISALAGRDRVLELYAEAVARRYRFFSYGDAMLLL